MRSIAAAVVIALAGASLAPARADTKPIAAKAPVAVESLGLTASKDRVRYRIRVDADHVDQVDIVASYTAAGKRESVTIAWQNIVKSKRQPIVKGKSYSDDSYLADGASDVVLELHRVVFTDHTTWTP